MGANPHAKIAMIAADGHAAADGVPIGALPLLGRLLVDAQVDAALAAGANRILFLVNAQSRWLDPVIDRLTARGISAERLKTGDDLTPFAASPMLLLAMSGETVPHPDMAEALRGLAHEQLLVIDADAAGDERERIDLNHRWAGVMLVEARRLADLAELPGEWNLLSALLRLAVQADVARKHVGAGPKRGELEYVTSRGDLAQLERRAIDAQLPAAGSFLSRWLVKPLVRIGLPRFMQLEYPVTIVAGATAGFGMIALLLGWLGWSVTAVFMVFATQLSGQSGLIALRIMRIKSPVPIMALTGSIAIITLVLLIWRNAHPVAMDSQLAFVPVIAGLSMLAEKTENSLPVMPWQADRLSILLLIFCAALTGHLMIGVWLATLWLLAGQILSAKH